MARRTLPATMLAALSAHRGGPTVWSQQPLQQQFTGPGDGDGDGGDGTGDGTDGNDGTGSDSASGTTGDDTGTDGGDEGDSDDDRPLGPKGQKALDAIKAQKKAEREKRLAAEKRIAELEAASGKGEDEVAKRERELTAKFNARILRSEVRAAAAVKFADPSDALKLLDLDQFEVGDDGEVDASEISDALDELLKTKPYLAASAAKGKVPAPDKRQGGAGGRKPSGRDIGKAEAERRFGKRTA